MLTANSIPQWTVIMHMATHEKCRGCSEYQEEWCVAWKALPLDVLFEQRVKDEQGWSRWTYKVFEAGRSKVNVKRSQVGQGPKWAGEVGREQAVKALRASSQIVVYIYEQWETADSLSTIRFTALNNCFWLNEFLSFNSVFKHRYFTSPIENYDPFYT